MKGKLEKQIQQIAEITGKEYKSLEHIGVLGGQSGVALFQFYCSKYFDDDTYSEKGVEIISNCVDMINSGYSFPTYCNGIAGFGWTLQHLVNQDFISLDLDELLNPFDDFLLSQMQHEFKAQNYDVLHGALGYGLYFLKRYESLPESIKNNSTHKEFLVYVVDKVEEMAIKDGDGLKWESVLDIEKGNKGYNLSLSHGMSSIIYVLYKLFYANIEKERVASLIRGAIKYIKSTQNLDGDLSQFPSWVESGVPIEYKSRLAWCYGDIGIAKAFEWSGKILDDLVLKRSASIILDSASKRKEPENTNVIDSGYCHGSFGNAHIFQQLGLQYKKKQFQETSTFWLRDGLSKHKSNSNAMYQQWNGMTKTWYSSISLLEGISGIGLTMIDFLSAKESKWDECLMLR